MQVSYPRMKITYYNNLLMDQEIKYYGFFNGDADGICSILQFIQSGFTIEHFFTGHKRDQALLRHGEALHNANILAFDVELAKNMDSVKKILNNGCAVTWFDHHGSGEESIFSEYINFFPNIDHSPDINTSLIVYNFLNNQNLLRWAIVGLFGDNIDNTALFYCKSLNLSTEETSSLSEIGKLINYNSYGESLSDLIMNPMDILHQAKQFIDPVSFYKETDIGRHLKKSSTEDLELALSYCEKDDKDHIVFLPDIPWARRVYGTLGNHLIKKDRTKPLAILVDIGEDNYLISVRAPLNQPTKAGDLCRLFDSGGGRASAGGINCLHKRELEKFRSVFLKCWSSGN
jgi:hypothetical protein